MKYVVTNVNLGFWDGKKWVAHIHHAKRFDSQNELMQEMKQKGYDRVKALIILSVEE